jgi:hypothetical protein
VNGRFDLRQAARQAVGEIGEIHLDFLFIPSLQRLDFSILGAGNSKIQFF